MAEHLCAIVPKERTSDVLEALRAEGCYDRNRHIREHDEETTAIPVTARPNTTDGIEELITVSDPAIRTRDLADHLCSRGWTDEALEHAPASWSIVGTVIRVRLPEACPDPETVGEALLDLHGGAESVIAVQGISGAHREPQTRLLAGDPDTETVHVEDGTRYALDPARVMFSTGNESERGHMAAIVESGERVFDMFAGIGYFTLPMARSGAHVTAAEINPTAFQYLLENAVLNEVTKKLDAYRADCRTVASSLAVDRVVMGYYGVNDGDGGRSDEAHTFLEYALEALDGRGVIHYHEATPESLLWGQPDRRLAEHLEGTGWSYDVRDRRRVKTHSPGVAHVVLDVAVRR